jgi:hypothetical protein
MQNERVPLDPVLNSRSSKSDRVLTATLPKADETKAKQIDESVN